LLFNANRLQVSNIDEKRNDVETFAGRLMNLQSELMAWKGALPTNLAFKNPVEIEEMNLDIFVCIDRQRRDIELRKYPSILCSIQETLISINYAGFNHVMLVLHRPFFAGTNFSTPFYDSNMARSVCLGAAQDTVLSMHKRLQKIRAVHEWPSGYHRLLAATIVILTIACESPAEEKAQLLETVSKSQELLESMQSVGLGLRVVSTGFYLLSGTLER
jgi:hypothetical protein